MLKKRVKSRIIKNSQSNKKDTGSADVQISLLSERIKGLSEHLNKNKKDVHSRRGLLKLVAQRKKLINYLKRANLEKLNEIQKKYNFKI